MKYSLYINQLAAMAAGLSLDIVDLGVFDVLKDFTNSEVCEKKVHEGHVWYNVPYRIIREQAPILGLSSDDSVYRRYKKLSEANVMAIGRSRDSNVWFRWSDRYGSLIFADPEAVAKVRKPVRFEVNDNLPTSSAGQTLDISKAAADLKTSWEAKEAAQRRYGIDIDFNALIDDFELYIRGIERPHYNTSQFRQNFFNWLKTNVKKPENAKQAIDKPGAIARAQQLADYIRQSNGNQGG